jgi:hypothetical protein
MLSKKKIQNAERRGAPIFSFSYKGKMRNVQINTKAVRDQSRCWGTPISNSVVRHNGKLYLTAVENNVDTPSGKQVKRFRLDQITKVKGI